MLLIWCLLSIGNNYYLDPDKIRGLSNTSFNSNLTNFWTYFLVLFGVGVYNFSLERRTYFSFENINLKFLTSSVLIVILGYLSSSNPIFNFLVIIFLVFQNTELTTRTCLLLIFGIPELHGEVVS